MEIGSMLASVYNIFINHWRCFNW